MKKHSSHAKHHPYSHTHIEHHKDGSHTVHHQHESDSKLDVKKAVADLDGVHDSMEEHLGQPNKGEPEAAPAPASPASTPGMGA